MIDPSRRLAEFEARYLRDAFRDLGYEEALNLFEALWVEARSINPHIGEDWQQDLEPDLAVARAVNGLPAIA
jgi:hypothetical protein